MLVVICLEKIDSSTAWSSLNDSGISLVFLKDVFNEDAIHVTRHLHINIFIILFKVYST